MKILTKLLTNASKKSAQPVSFVKVDIEPVKEISANDGIKFDSEGIPFEFTLDIHQITKRNFTPTNIYSDPPNYPWAEVSKHKKTEVNLPPVVPVALDNTKPVKSSGGDISVYNGYPVKFNVDGEMIIAINNRGDTTFNKNSVYLLHGATEVVLKGKFVEILDCNTYTKDYIAEIQNVVWYV